MTVCVHVIFFPSQPPPQDNPRSQFTPVSLLALSLSILSPCVTLHPWPELHISFSSGVNFLSTAARMKRTHWLPTMYTASPPLPPKDHSKLDIQALGRCKRHSYQLGPEKKCACLFALLILFTFPPTVTNEIAWGSVLQIFYTLVTRELNSNK